jgi:hypothetical protein
MTRIVKPEDLDYLPNQEDREVVAKLMNKRSSATKWRLNYEANQTKGDWKVPKFNPEIMEKIKKMIFGD